MKKLMIIFLSFLFITQVFATEEQADFSDVITTLENNQLACVDISEPLIDHLIETQRNDLVELGKDSCSKDITALEERIDRPIVGDDILFLKMDLINLRTLRGSLAQATVIIKLRKK